MTTIAHIRSLNGTDVLKKRKKYRDTELTNKIFQRETLKQGGTIFALVSFWEIKTIFLETMVGINRK